MTAPRWAVILGVCCAVAAHAAPPEHRALWANYRDILTPEKVQETVERVAAAHLNAIYILVWYNGGQAAYRSALGPTMEGVPEGFDPLGALVTEAHARGIHVHAWFVNGSAGWAMPGYVFTQHPEWKLQNGRDTYPPWYDLGRPEVRAFERDVMLECLRNYDLDGLHFDYIRYDGRGMCYCDACQAEVQRRYGLPPVSPDSTTFPIAAQVTGNPLDQPTTAQVLATFDNGKPAITLNRLGEGEAVQFNWHATRTGGGAMAAFAKSLLQRFGVAEGTVYQLRTSQTAARYNLSYQEDGVAWLEGLGVQVKALDETELAEIPAGATVTLFAQYLIDQATAEWLAGFVRGGGHVISVDGPVFAMEEPALQEVLGLAGTTNYFSEFRAISPAPGQDLIPAGPPLDLETERRRAGCWVEFWTDSVTDLVRQVYREAKALKPEAWVSAAVFYNKSAGDGVCQDWYGWLREGIIDYVLPMAYTEDNEILRAALDEWRAADPQMARIIPGLSIYSMQDETSVARERDLIKAQQELCASYQVHGTCYFALDYLTPELASQFVSGPYAEVTEPYYPAGRP